LWKCPKCNKKKQFDRATVIFEKCPDCNVFLIRFDPDDENDD